MGMIAEDVYKIKPGICFNDSQGKLSGIAYERLITPMVKLLQEQKTLITALQIQVAELESKIK